MRNIVIFLLGLVLSYTTLAQSCDTPALFNEIKTFNDKGNFNEALRSADRLLSCSSLTTAVASQAYIWKFRLYRSKLEEKNANEAILMAKSLLEEHDKELTLEFRLLLAESSAIRNDTAQYNAGLRLLKSEIFDTAIKNDLAKGRYYLLTSNQYPDAIPILLNALKHFETLKVAPVYYMGSTLRSLGNITSQQGDFEKGEAYYKRELALYERTYPDDHFDISVCYYHFGNIGYERLEYESALENYLKAFKVWEDYYERDHYRMKGLNEAIGDMYWELGNKDKALDFFNKATLNARVINNDRSENTIIDADSLFDKGNYNAAIAYYEEAMSWREQTFGKEHLLTGACKNFVARAIRSSGNIEGSLDSYQDAIDILVEEMEETTWYENPTKLMTVKSHRYLLEALTAKSELLREWYETTKDLTDLQTSLATFETSLSVIEAIKNTQISEGSRDFWMKRTLTIAENGIDTALQLYDITQDQNYLISAFNFSERSKALVLLASMYSQNIDKFVNIPEEVLHAEKRLTTEMTNYIGKLEIEEKRCAAVRQKMLSLYKSKLQSLRDEFELLIKNIEQNYPDYYHLKYDPKIATIKSLQNEIVNENTQLLHFFTGERFLFVFSIVNDALSVRKIDNAPDVYQTTEALFLSVSNQKIVMNNPQQAYEEFTSLSYDLYTQLIEKEVANSTKENLIIVPDGKLSYLPFDILITSPPPNKRDYLILDYMLRNKALSYSPSASILLLTKDLNNTASDYIGFAPQYQEEEFSTTRSKLANLQHNTTEVAFATQLFHGKSWTGSNVSEEILKKHASEAGILHLAMHGDVEDKNPLLSKLYFNPSSNEDGLLHTYEIYNLSIPSQLVILSACNTATGKLDRGEGIISLERAFQFAGSKSMLSTMWAVDDVASAQLSQHFMVALKEGTPKNVALQQAKIDFLITASPEKRHPFYWSSLKLTGNVASIMQTPSTSWLWWVLGACGLLVSGAFFRKKILFKS